jgi:hypothetical protein
MSEQPTRVPRKVRSKKEDRTLGPVIRLRSSISALLILSIASIVAGIWILASTLMFIRIEDSLLDFVIGGGVIFIGMVFFVLPLTLGHVLTGMALIIRYGIQFKVEIPFYDIETAEPVGSVPGKSGLLGSGMKLGVTYSNIDERFTVLRSKKGIVRIKLANSIGVNNWFIPRVTREIVFDTADSKAVLKRIEDFKSREVNEWDF